MKYQVEWVGRAIDGLATAWLTASDRNSVTYAAAWFENRLAFRPYSLGESRTSSLHRVAQHPPLGIEYIIIEDDYKDIVENVFYLPPRRTE